MAEKPHWYVSAYYGVDAEKSKTPGTLAFMKALDSETEADAAYLDAESRVDIDRVVKDGPITTLWTTTEEH